MDTRHKHVHPIFQPLLDAITPALGNSLPEPVAEQRAAAIESLAANEGPLTPELSYVAQVVETEIDPAQAAYRALIDELAANVPDVGYYDVKQMRPLTNAEKATVLEANPDAVNNLSLEPDQIVSVLRGELDVGLWMLSLVSGPLREWLFEDVLAEIERDEDVVHQDAMDPYQRRGDQI